MFSFLNSSFNFLFSLPACVTQAILPYVTMTFKEFKEKLFVKKKKQKRKSTLFPKVHHPGLKNSMQQSFY